MQFAESFRKSLNVILVEVSSETDRRHLYS